MLDMRKTPPATGPSTVEIVRTLIEAEQASGTRQPAPYDLATITRQSDTGAAELQIRRATVEDRPVILGLIEEAKAWLKTKGTDQWSTDWPDKDGRRRSDRVEISLKEETTWLVWFVSENEKTAVATVTIEKNATPGVWPDSEVSGEPAAYLSRLVTAREFAALGIGAALLDWACAYAAREFEAKVIRIDVWTDNYALHEYYKDQGFHEAGLCPNEDYPSRALFYKYTSDIKAHGLQFAEP